MLTQPATVKERQQTSESKFPAHALTPGLVLITSLILAGMLFVRYWREARSLWDNPIHDRNAHLYSGLCLANDVAHRRWGQMLSDLDSFRTWPPLHDGLLVGTALLIGHGHEQWAVIPSLFGWVGTATFAFLLARRMVSRGGTLAGLIAALFVLVSPAQRAYATDVMLESLGACLTLGCLYFSLRTEQEPSARNARCLAVALTLLFFEKYNYWLLVVLALGVNHAWSHRRRLTAYCREHLTVNTIKHRMAREARQPLTWVLLILLGLCLAVSLTGGTDLTLYGKRISIHSAANLMTVAYLVFLLRLAPWYRSQSREWLRTTDPRTQALVTWHVWPVVVWLLWPQRLFSLLWVIDPAANAGTHPQHNLLGGYLYYWGCLTHDYHVSAWSALAALGLAVVAVAAGLRGALRPGASTILWLLLLSTLLTAHHPYRDSRFLHSWIPALWVCTGVGAAILVFPLHSAGRVFRPFLAAAVALLAALHGPALLAPPHAPEGGIHPGARSTLDITDAYLPDLAAARHAAVLSNVPLKFLAQWTYLQRYGRASRLETDVPGVDPSAPNNADILTHWLATTPCDTLVTLDLLPGTAFSATVPGSAGSGQYERLLSGQTLFVPIRRHFLPASGCIVTIWRRKP